METEPEEHRESLGPEQAAARAALLAACDTLSAAGVTFVAVHFDGYDDDGTTEEVKCYAGDWFGLTNMSRSNMTSPACKNTSKLLCPLGMRTIAADSATLFSMCALSEADRRAQRPF